MGDGFTDAIVGGVSKLIRKAIQSPNYVPNVSGWSINKDGTAQFNELTLIGANGGVFIYNGPASAGNLIGSWSPTAGTDAFGNAYPAGLYTNQAQLTGIGILNADIIQSFLDACSIGNASINDSTIVGGQIVETQITFDTTGGNLLIYTKSTTTTTLTGEGSWTAPAGSTGTAKIECWGAGGGAGNNGSGAGGGGGGGGEYACEPNYPITAGQSYSYNAGLGGNGTTANAAGGRGNDTFFDNGNVYAHGGGAGGISNLGTWVGGAGGTGSTNSIHFNGGAGGNGSNLNGGGGGGSSAGSAANGTRGTDGSSIGGPGGTAPTGGGNGGAGGNNGVAGGIGSTPGGGGGGSGINGGSTARTDSFTPTGTYSYYGSDNQQGFPRTLSNTNGNMQQGCPNDPSLGTFFSFAHYNSAAIQSALSGRTVDAISMDINCLHSWYNSGMTIYVDYTNIDSFPSPISIPGSTHIGSYGIGEGQTENVSLPVSVASAFQSGAAHTLYFHAPNQGLSYYGYYQGGTSGPRINIASHTGSSPVSSGKGADGQIKVTYTSSIQLAASFSGTAFTDQYGNSIPVGVMVNGLVVIQPGSSPAVAETWHTPSLGTGWATGSRNAGWQNVRYRLTPWNEVEIAGIIHTTSTTPSATIWTMPTGYRPTTTQRMNAVTNASGGVLGVNGIDVHPDGTVTIEVALTAANTDVQFGLLYALD